MTNATIEQSEKDKDIHTMPNNGKHSCSSKCFCEPVVYYEDEVTGIKCYMHKSDEELNQ